MAPRLANNPRGVSCTNHLSAVAQELNPHLCTGRRWSSAPGLAVLAQPRRVLVGEDEQAQPPIGSSPGHARAERSLRKRTLLVSSTRARYPVGRSAPHRRAPWDTERAASRCAAPARPSPASRGGEPDEQCAWPGRWRSPGGRSGRRRCAAVAPPAARRPRPRVPPAAAWGRGPVPLACWRFGSVCAAAPRRRARTARRRARASRRATATAAASPTRAPWAERRGTLAPWRRRPGRPRSPRRPGRSSRLATAWRCCATCS